MNTIIFAIPIPVMYYIMRALVLVSINLHTKSEVTTGAQKNQNRSHDPRHVKYRIYILHNGHVTYSEIMISFIHHKW